MQLRYGCDCMGNTLSFQFIENSFRLIKRKENKCLVDVQCMNSPKCAFCDSELQWLKKNAVCSIDATTTKKLPMRPSAFDDWLMVWWILNESTTTNRKPNREFACFMAVWFDKEISWHKKSKSITAQNEFIFIFIAIRNQINHTKRRTSVWFFFHRIPLFNP